MGNESVGEFFADYWEDYSGTIRELAFQKSFLRIVHHLGIVNGEYLGKLQQRVATRLIQRILDNLPRAVQFDLRKDERIMVMGEDYVTDPPEEQMGPIGKLLRTGDIVYTPRETEKGNVPDEEIENFAKMIGESFARDTVMESLSGLVNMGLYGRGLEVQIIGTEDGPMIRKINVDECFRRLSTYYKPRLMPAEIPRDRWDRD